MTLTEAQQDVVLLVTAGALVIGCALVWWAARGERKSSVQAPELTAPTAPKTWPTQAVKLTSGPGEMPVLPVRPMDPIAALEATDKLAEKQGGAHLVAADRSSEDPDVKWALTQWHLQQQGEERKRRHGW